MGGKGASMHDKMMTALHGNNYAGSIAERSQNAKADLDYRLGKGMTKGEIRSEQKDYKKLFKQIDKREKKQERFDSGGFLGKKK